jgi:hypothetical protein
MSVVNSFGSNVIQFSNKVQVYPVQFKNQVSPVFCPNTVRLIAEVSHLNLANVLHLNLANQGF